MEEIGKINQYEQFNNQKKAQTTKPSTSTPVRNSRSVGLPTIPDLLDIEEKSKIEVKSDIINRTGPVGKPLNEPASQLDSFKKLQKSKSVSKVSPVKKEVSNKEEPKKDRFVLPKLD